LSETGYVEGQNVAIEYPWRCRPPSAHAMADTALLKQIRTVHASSRETYGAPRVQAALKAGGEKHGRKRIAGKTFVFETSLAEYSDRNNGAASTKDRDERNCPDGIAEQRRSDSHTHGHDEHDCGRNNGNKPVHGAP
jgi:putative transposase